MAYNNQTKDYIYIDSVNRISGTHSDFEIEIPLDKNHVYDSVCLRQFSCPKTYYTVDGTESLTLIEDGVEITVTPTKGNYTVPIFKSVIGALLTSSSLNGITYTVSVPSSLQVQTGKFTFTSDNIALSQSLKFGDVHLSQIFGFERNTTNTFTAGASTSTLESTRVFRLQLVDALLLKSDICDDDGRSVLQELYVNTADLGNIEFKNETLVNSKHLTNHSRNVFRFSLVREYDDKVIDLNGSNVTFSLVLYKNEHHELNRLMKQDILISNLEKMESSRQRK